MAEMGPRGAVLTPWGNADELRERMLPPGPGTPREEVVRNQRERLFGAMVACVAEKGYEATTVADLLALSGVSRSAFYERFRDKEDCFLATFDAAAEKALAMFEAELGHDGPPVDHREGALTQLFGMVARQTATARLCLIDAYGAGKAGHAAIEGTLGRFVPLTAAAIARARGDDGLPAAMVRGLVGGVQTVLQKHLRRREMETLTSLVPDLWGWALGYQPPPVELRLSGRRPRTASHPPPAFAGYSQAEQIVRALAAAAAERGYPAVTIAEIAARASVSQATFYSHFDGKDAALDAALDSAGSQALAAMLPAGRRAVDWPHGVRAAIGALCWFGVAEPDLMWLGAVEAYAAGERAFRARSRLIAGVGQTLRPGFELAPGTKPIVADAVLGAAWSLLHQQIVEEGPQSLPEVAPLVSYMVLSPFIGAEQAAEVANGDGRPAR